MSVSNSSTPFGESKWSQSKSWSTLLFDLYAHRKPILHRFGALHISCRQADGRTDTVLVAIGKGESPPQGGFSPENAPQPFGFGSTTFLPLDEAIVSRAVFVIVSVSDGRADGNAF